MRRVEGLPLNVLWNKADERDYNTRRMKDLLRDEADALIMDRGADIVVAQVGAPLLWLQRESIRDFWRETPKSGYYFTITAHGQLIDKATKPTYLFYPSKWEPISDFPLVLLEMVCWPYDSALKMF
jgi:hypothetical protein